MSACGFRGPKREIKKKRFFFEFFMKFCLFFFAFANDCFEREREKRKQLLFDEENFTYRKSEKTNDNITSRSITFSFTFIKRCCLA